MCQLLLALDIIYRKKDRPHNAELYNILLDSEEKVKLTDFETTNIRKYGNDIGTTMEYQKDNGATEFFKKERYQIRLYC